MTRRPKPIRALLAGALATLPAAAHAQLAELANRAQQQAARLAPLTCSFDAVDYSGIEPVRRAGKLEFRAPDQCRMTTEPGINLPGGRIVIANGTNTLIRVPGSGRVHRFTRNLFSDWATGFAGPANFAAFGMTFNQLTRDYSVLIVPAAPTAGRPTVTVTLNELRPRERLVKDHVDAGGEDIQIAYLAYKRKVYLRPPRVRLLIDTERWLVLKREQFDSPDVGARPTRTDTLLSAREVTAGLWFPERYETRSPDGALLATYLYREAKAGVAPEANRFLLSAASDEIVEDAELQSLDLYRQQQSANTRAAETQLNLAQYDIQWQEDPTEALKHLAAAERENPNSVAPAAMRAELFMGISRFAEAAQQWARVRERMPSYPQVNALLARALLADKDRKGAEAAFEAQIQKHPADADARIALAELLTQNRQFERAAQMHRDTLAAAHVSLRARLQAADDLVTLHRWRKQLEALVATPGTDPVLIKLRGDALLLSGNPARALAEFRSIPAEPEALLVRYAAAQSLERAGLFNEAREVYNGSDGSVGLAALGTGVTLGVNAMRRLLALDAAAGGIDDALATLHKLVDPEPSLRARIAQRALFIQYFQKNLRLEELIKALEAKVNATATATAPATAPDELAALLLVDAYPRMGQGARALDLIRSGPARFPRSAWWHSKLAAQLVAEAREKYSPDKVPGNDPFNYPPRIALLRAARESADRAIAAEPNLYYEAQRVFIYDAARLPATRQQAQDAALQILRRYPGDPDAYVIRAVLERTQKLSEPSASIPVYRQALELGVPFEDRHQELYFIRQSLADCYRKTGSYPEAYRQYFLLFDTARNHGERMQMVLAILLSAGQQKNQAQAVSVLADLCVRLVARKDLKANREALLSEALDPDQFEALTKNKDLWGLVQNELRQRLQAAPNDPYLNLLVGRFLLSAALRAPGGSPDPQQLDQSEQLHERAAQAAEQDPDLDAWLAEVYALKKGYVGAAERLQRALDRDPIRLVDWFTLSNVYVQQRKLNEVVALPQQMLLRLPSDTMTLRAAGSLYLKHAGRYSDAVALYREAHRLSLLDPTVDAFDTVDILVYLARAEALNGQTAEAARKFRELADKVELGKPARIDAYVVLSDIHFAEKKYADCIHMLRLAKELATPEVAVALDERIKRAEAAQRGG